MPACHQLQALRPNPPPAARAASARLPRAARAAGACSGSGLLRNDGACSWRSCCGAPGVALPPAAGATQSRGTLAAPLPASEHRRLLAYRPTPLAEHAMVSAWEAKERRMCAGSTPWHSVQPPFPRRAAQPQSPASSGTSVLPLHGFLWIRWVMEHQRRQQERLQQSSCMHAQVIPCICSSSPCSRQCRSARSQRQLGALIRDGGAGQTGTGLPALGWPAGAPLGKRP